MCQKITHQNNSNHSQRLFRILPQIAVTVAVPLSIMVGEKTMYTWISSRANCCDALFVPFNLSLLQLSRLLLTFLSEKNTKPLVSSRISTSCQPQGHLRMVKLVLPQDGQTGSCLRMVKLGLISGWSNHVLPQDGQTGSYLGMIKPCLTSGWSNWVLTQDG